MIDSLLCIHVWPFSPRAAKQTSANREKQGVSVFLFFFLHKEKKKEEISIILKRALTP